MRRTLCLGVVAFAALVATPTEISAMTGNEYRDLPTGDRLHYVIGVLDGWAQVGRSLKTVNRESPDVEIIFGRLIKCATSGMTQGQILAIVDKYLQDRPKAWHHAATSAIYVAMADACKQ